MDEFQMEPELVTEERLLGALQGLMSREPLFHRRELVNCRDDFERETAEDFWETGASGHRYSREFVWATLKERYSAATGTSTRLNSGRLGTSTCGRSHPGPTRCGGRATG
jgi:hypothetical protein